MRLRDTVIAAAGALPITLSVPTSAPAAVGEFQYRGPLGKSHTLLDPLNDECIEVPEATDLVPAHSPQNLTDSTATIFRSAGCDGDDYIVMLPGKRLGLLTGFRSVIFS
ncbi:hypothetical protein OH807_12155 [Kitasatospora sp. NBC_01560]|uniref:hypothetical protein n=1 Tax=Kitasatospora sp. NBC_01560 TaxID=2975965 RepID=UPI00386E2BD0